MIDTTFISFPRLNVLRQKLSKPIQYQIKLIFYLFFTYMNQKTKIDPLEFNIYVNKLNIQSLFQLSSTSIFQRINQTSFQMTKFQKSTEINKIVTQKLKKQGQRYFKRRMYTTAISYFSTALNYSQKDSQIYYLLGYSYYNLSDFQNSLVGFKKCIEINPDDAQTCLKIGNIYSQVNNYSEAVEWFQNCIKIDKELVEGYLCLGENYMNIGQFKKAKINYENCLDVNCECFAALFNLAKVYKQQRQYELAIDCYQKCIKINPQSSANCIYQIGCVYELLEVYRTARKYFIRYMNTYPNQKNVYKKIASLYFKQQKYDKSIQWILRFSHLKKIKECDELQPNSHRYKKIVFRHAMDILRVEFQISRQSDYYSYAQIKVKELLNYEE